MKTETRILDVQGNLEGEKVQMGIDQNALAKIMNILTDLYSDPVLAVIREYSTNAFDAHVQAGQTRPIEVTLPSALAPFFRVKDYGVGLSSDDIRNIYSQYGASTKTDSNEVVGMLGLGCKSALTYTDQFTVSSVKDGVCVQVSVSRDEDGGSSMTIVAEYETEESNGTEVVVPSKSAYAFEEKAKNFFRFWTEGTVLVNGKTPEVLKGIKLTDNIIMSEELDSSVIVMGNVAYPYEDGDNYYNRNVTATYVNIGDVNFTPSRESLMMTPKTIATVAEVKETVKREKQAAFQREIDAQTTKFDALKTMYKVESLGFDSKDAAWNGVKLPVSFESPDPKNPYTFLVAPGTTYRGSNAKGMKETRLYLKGIVNHSAIWFTGFTGSEISPYKRRKLDMWLDNNNLSTPHRYIFVAVIPQDVMEWVEPSNVYDFATVEAIKLPANPTKRRDGRPTGSYQAVVNGVNETLQAADIDTSNPVYWVDKNVYYYTYLGLVAEAEKDGYTLVLLGKNRINKFKRDFPAAVKLTDAIDSMVKKWTASLTDDDKLYLNVHIHSVDFLSGLDADLIDDPDLANVVRIARSKRASLKDAYQNFRGHLKDDVLGNYTCPTKKYPLLDSISYYGYNEKEKLHHIHLYLNAAHAAGQES